MSTFKKVIGIANGKHFSGISKNPKIGSKSEIWSEDGEHRVVVNNAGAFYKSNTFNQKGFSTADVEILQIGEDATFPKGSYASIVFS